VTRVLLVDDDESLTETLHLDLCRRGHAVRSCASAQEAVVSLQRDEIDVIVTDLNMPGTTGIQLCAHVVAHRPDVPVVVLTAFGSLETAVEAIRAGAYDFISKPVQLDVLAIAIERAATHRKLREQVRLLEREIAPARDGNGIVTASSAMRGVLDLVDRVAQSDATVLVTGESGSGKEVIARAIHAAGRRKGGKFVAVNCAAVPEGLLESELFGHVRGSFTDARTSEPGLFVSATGGTIFLDEIGDMPLAVQPKLLRVLQERTVRPVGSSAERPIDVRVIAATNRDLESAVEERRFREDLFYRLNVVQIALPPLRARAADVLPLAQHFAAAFAGAAGKPITGIAAAAAERLVAYPWPGNVRELQNCMERAVALARFDQISVDDLPEKVRDHRANHLIVSADDPSDLIPLEQLERQYIARVMEAVAGNKSAAARVLGIDRKRLYRMLERLGIQA
jgi:two-component system response regulator HydG